MEAFALFGYIDAINKYDPDSSMQFEAFALPLIEHTVEAELRARE